MDKSNLTGMVLLDLQKVFDTIDHGILLMKLETIGLNADGLSWFQSYLSGRGTCSSFTDVNCNVAQGSILGSLLFLIYVNDMAVAVDEKFLLYADDIAVLVSKIMLMLLNKSLELLLRLSVSDSSITNYLCTLGRLILFYLVRNKTLGL